MGAKLSNAELLSQISDGRLNIDESAELLRLNRKFSYYRNVNSMMKQMHKRNPVTTLDSDDYAHDISQNLLNSVLRIGRDVTTEKDEQDYYRLIELLAELGGEDALVETIYSV